MTDYWEQHLARLRGHELADLRWHWDEAYRIWWDGQFRAARLDGRTQLAAGNADDLRELMRDDYCHRPVRRMP